MNLLPQNEFEWVNHRLAILGYLNLEAYYGSELWKGRRARYSKTHEYKCNDCDCREKLHLHHKTYKNLGNEPDSDLMFLCKKHHYKLHRKWTKKEKRRKLFLPAAVRWRGQKLRKSA